MKLHFKAKQVQISEAVEQQFARKLERMEKHLGRDVEAYINCSRNRNQDRVEVTLYGAGVEMRAEDSAGDLYSALDLVCERLERQVERFKTRLELRRHARESIRKAPAEMLPEVALPLVRDGNAPAEGQPRIVRSKKFALKPLDPEEACMHMELLGHSFFVFLNAESEAVNVVYRRHDGDYGLIEPE